MPDAEIGGLAHELDPEAARLREERDVAGGRWIGRERRIHPHAGRGANDAETVGTDDAHAVATRGRYQLPLDRLTFGTDLRETGRDDHDAVHMFLRALTDHIGHGGGRYDDDCEVDDVGNLEKRGIRPHAGDRHRRGIHGIHRPLETERQQVAEELVADGAGMPAGTDHRDRARRHQPGDRRALGVPLSTLDRIDRLRRRVDVEPNPNRSLIEVPLAHPARGGEDIQHLQVVGERVGQEHVNTVAASHDREMLEQDGRQTPTLLIVIDGERNLGFAVGGAVIPRDGNDLVAELRDEHHAVVIVDARDPLELYRGRARYRREEPEVDRLIAQPLVEREHGRLVVGAHRSNTHRPAVGENDVVFPLRRILGHEHQGYGGTLLGALLRTLVAHRAKCVRARR